MRASAITCEPPRGYGQPPAWASPASSIPAAAPASVGCGEFACATTPAMSAAASSVRKAARARGVPWSSMRMA